MGCQKIIYYELYHLIKKVGITYTYLFKYLFWLALTLASTDNKEIVRKGILKNRSK